MKRINFLFFFIFSVIIATGCSQQNKNTAGNKKPNVIIILTDDAGYADFGAYGGTEIPTPNIDSLLASGVKFTNAYVTASVCAPSRAGLLTGRYQQRFGFENNMSGEPAEGFTKQDMGMDPEENTFADEMRANGYRTLAIGKWHLGDEEKHFPLNRGFDEFYGFVGGHRSFFPIKGKVPADQVIHNNKSIVSEDSVTYLTDMWTDKAISFMTQKAEKPFFVYLAYNAVHTPVDAKKEYWDKFSSIADSGRRSYAALMASLDDNVGRLRQSLKENNLDENTLILFLNDNGGATTNSSDNGPLRGMKGSVWEGGTRVAMSMIWKNKLPHNVTFDYPVNSLDFLPTSLAAANGKQVGKKTLDGKNLLPYIKGETKEAPHEALFWRRGVAAAVREGNWKLIRVETDPILLFDLSKDLSETKNLAKENPEKVKHLLAKLAEWEKGLSKPHWSSSYGPENLIIKHRMETVGRDMERMYP
ncbi:sulfatase [Pedobacter arcticus]|uniref:sulfatase n=1 Tax=Pedobacter arcticus TaxID=752140 RepID=UPI00030EF7CA|nr:sulfatase [Pedobacter arcticus]